MAEVILVCGGRSFGCRASSALSDRKLLFDRLGQSPLPSLIISGGAPGADSLAEYWARKNGIHAAVVMPIWSKYGNKAGPLRNAAMLRLKPDRVIAFPGGRGTENCIRQAEEAGIPVEKVGWSECKHFEEAPDAAA